MVVGVLWDCLGDLKDDLSSSIGGVMDLLGTSPFASTERVLTLTDVQPSYLRSQSYSTLFSRLR
jgi:hypothetical protein